MIRNSLSVLAATFALITTASPASTSSLVRDFEFPPAGVKVTQRGAELRVDLPGAIHVASPGEPDFRQIGCAFFGCRIVI